MTEKCTTERRRSTDGPEEELKALELRSVAYGDGVTILLTPASG